MATQRNQPQSGDNSANLRGTTEEGVEVEATLDDDSGLEAGADEADDETADSGSQRGGAGNFANDRARASDAGRKGGRH